MNYFEIRNADDILTINDNESCLYLKISNQFKNLPLHDRRVESGFEYLYKGDGIAYINTPRGTYQAAMYIPIRLRKRMSITRMHYPVALLYGMCALQKFVIKDTRIESTTGQITYR